jgi:outer membrane protein assembly factor BamB
VTVIPRSSRAAWLFAILGLLGCSSESLDDAGEPEPMQMPPVEMPPVEMPADYGLGDGTLASVQLEEVFRPTARVPLSATALAWNAAVPGELWVTLRQFPSGKPCTEAVSTGCAALQGVAAVITAADSAAPQGVLKEDGNSWHFMRRPVAIAWGDGELFGTCGESLTDNYENVPVPYAGPVLWSSNPDIFGVEPTAGQNGTHMDMLHETPYCMGIAHETGNAYWVFNGNVGSLDRYDFHAPHQIGGEDHADGEVYRYALGELLRQPEVPSHLAYDAQRKRVYVADTGHGRVVAVDPSTATLGGDIDVYEELHGSGEMVGATVSELVAPGTVQAPSGVALVGNVLYVTDNASSMIYAFDTSGKQLAALDTALPSGTLSGIAVGPDKKLYFTDLLTGAVRRISAL